MNLCQHQMACHQQASRAAPSCCPQPSRNNLYPAPLRPGGCEPLLEQARIASMGGMLSRAIESQAQQLSAMSGHLSAFKQQKQQDIVQLQASLAVAHDGLGRLQALVEQQAQAAAVAGRAALQQAGASADDYMGRALAAASELEGAARTAIGGLVASLEEQAEQVRAFAARQEREASESAIAIAGGMQRAAGGFAGLRDSATAVLLGAQRRHDAVASALDDAAGAYQAGLRQSEEQLATQIAALLRSHVEERSAALGAAVEAVKQRAQAGQAELAGELQGMQEAASGREAETQVRGAKGKVAGGSALRPAPQPLCTKEGEAARPCYGRCASAEAHALAMCLALPCAHLIPPCVRAVGGREQQA